MKSMVERIAGCITGGSVFSAEDRIEIAKNILIEIRSPTQAMIDSRFLKLGQGGRVEYEALIDGALKEYDEQS